MKYRPGCRMPGVALAPAAAWAIAAPGTAWAQGGHGPAFGLATPTGGKGALTCNLTSMALVHDPGRSGVMLRHTGFGARDAWVRVQGSVALEGGVLVLRTPVEERFRLEGDDADLPEAGREGELHGRVAVEPDAAGRWVLRVGQGR